MVITHDVRPGAISRRRRYLAWFVAAAVVLAILIAGPISNWSVDHPHGNPDPGGRRIAYLSRTARKALPSTATDTHVTVLGYSWDAGGCDGGDPGWARGVVNATFRNSTVASVDAAMADIGWKVSRWIGGVRDYVPANGNPYDAVATLFVARRTWTLNLSADPAETPTHSC